MGRPCSTRKKTHGRIDSDILKKTGSQAASHAWAAVKKATSGHRMVRYHPSFGTLEPDRTVWTEIKLWMLSFEHETTLAAWGSNFGNSASSFAIADLTLHSESRVLRRMQQRVPALGPARSMLREARPRSQAGADRGHFTRHITGIDRHTSTAVASMVLG